MTVTVRAAGYRNFRCLSPTYLPQLLVASMVLHRSMVFCKFLWVKAAQIEYAKRHDQVCTSACTQSCHSAPARNGHGSGDVQLRAERLVPGRCRRFQTALSGCRRLVAVHPCISFPAFSVTGHDLYLLCSRDI